MEISPGLGRCYPFAWSDLPLASPWSHRPYLSPSGHCSQAAWFTPWPLPRLYVALCFNFLDIPKCHITNGLLHHHLLCAAVYFKHILHTKRTKLSFLPYSIHCFKSSTYTYWVKKNAGYIFTMWVKSLRNTKQWWDYCGLDVRCPPTGLYVWMFGTQLVMPLYNPEEVEPSWRKWFSTVTGTGQSRYLALLPKLPLLPLLERCKMSQQIRNGFTLPWASCRGHACLSYLLQMNLIFVRCGPKHILPPLTVRHLVKVMIQIRNLGDSK